MINASRRFFLKNFSFLSLIFCVHISWRNIGPEVAPLGDIVGEWRGGRKKEKKKKGEMQSHSRPMELEFIVRLFRKRERNRERKRFPWVTCLTDEWASAWNWFSGTQWFYLLSIIYFRRISGLVQYPFVYRIRYPVHFALSFNHQLTVFHHIHCSTLNSNYQSIFCVIFFTKTQIFYYEFLIFQLRIKKSIKYYIVSTTRVYIFIPFFLW